MLFATVIIAVLGLGACGSGSGEESTGTGSGDENSRFTLTTQGITEGELRIYNREGNLVYSTKSYDTEGWDGGKCRSGNYVWRFDYHAIDYPETRQTEVGTVLLIR